MNFVHTAVFGSCKTSDEVHVKVRMVGCVPYTIFVMKIVKKSIKDVDKQEKQ